MLAISPTPDSPPAPVYRVERVQVSARIVRGVEASKRRTASHNPDRIRTIIEKLPDGREAELIILDFE